MVFAGIVAAVLAGSSALQAQATQKPGQDTAKGKSVQLTGCLAKGTDAGSFMLNNATEASASKEAAKGAAAKSYHLVAKDSSLKLADHVGHTVEITGTVEPMGAAKSSAAASGAAGKAGDMPHVTVTAMKHVAGSCK
jgi:hypothetical protein